MSSYDYGTKTPWGYYVNVENLPNLVSVTEFNAFTNSKFVGDSRVMASIPGASAAIRNFCGWHVSPSLQCGAFYNVHALRDAFVGGDLLVQLPATFVSSVSLIVLGAVWDSVLNEWQGDIIHGEDLDRYDLETNGVLRIYDAAGLDRKARIFIKFEAGYQDSNIPVIKELAANLITHATATAYGVNSESAGGVSVSYNSAWVGQPTAVSLSGDSRQVLTPYKVRGVF